MAGPDPAAGKVGPPAPTVVNVDQVPDPDEDDLDDLDDMLDDFSTMNVQPPKPPFSTTTTQASTSGPASTATSVPPPGAPGAGAPGPPPEDADIEALLGDDEFTKELAKNMANLFGGTDMEAQLKSFIQDFTGGQDGGQSSSSATPASSSSHHEKPPEPSLTPAPPPGTSPTADADASTFQTRINDTIRRLQQSNRQATEATTSSSNAPPDDDFMATMLQQLSEGGAAGAALGANNEEDFSKLLLGMMEELTHKEILYEPMKELDEKFPRWLDENKAKVSAADLARYQLQRSIVRDIVARYDRTGYADSDPADREYIVGKMQKMQEAGAPPPDLVGDMSSANDMLNTEEGCNPQ